MSVSFQVLSRPTLPTAYSAYDYWFSARSWWKFSPANIRPVWLIETNISSHVNQIWNIYRRRQVPSIAYQNTSILPLYVLGKRIDVPSCNVECNERMVDWYAERSLGNLFWLHTAQPMMISWGERTLRIAEFIHITFRSKRNLGSRRLVNIGIRRYGICWRRSLTISWV